MTDIIKVAEATKRGIEFTWVETASPIPKSTIEASKIACRLYISESLPKSNVEADPVRAGNAISQGKSGMPLSSAIIRGWAGISGVDEKITDKLRDKNCDHPNGNFLPGEQVIFCKDWFFSSHD